MRRLMPPHPFSPDALPSGINKMSHADDPQQGCSPGMNENGLPLPDPFPEYVECPYCGEPEVEVWCYQTRVQCHACGCWLPHRPPKCFGTSEKCRGKTNTQQP